LAGVPGRGLDKPAEKPVAVSAKDEKRDEKRPHKVGV
jgi:hypothetical protein